MAMFLTGFFNCPCGKLHCYAGVTRTTVCPTCKRELWSLAVTGNVSLSPRVFTERLNAANRQTVESWQRYAH